MKKKEKIRIGIVFFLILLLAICLDITGGELKSDGTIARDVFGGDEKTIELLLDAEGVLEEYSYQLEIEPTRVTEELADEYFLQAIEIIDKDFGKIEEKVPLQEEYLGGLVSAEWEFDPYGYVTMDGGIVYDEIGRDGVLINATVSLVCGEYEMEYSFPFRIEEKKLSKEEVVLQGLSEWISKQMELEGVESIELPSEVAGYKLTWSEKKDRLAIKVLFLEMVAVLMIAIANKKKLEKEEKERLQRLEEDYPDIVNQLVVLLGAGMTMRQAWAKISSQYEDKRRNEMLEKREAYEEIYYMNRRILEGENERIVYQDFVDRTNAMCYRRLIRLLLNNLEKGSKGLCNLLEEECEEAFEQRILAAKAKGEEASTKMLVPLMIMMVLVMAIVLLPAIISFSI